MARPSNSTFQEPDKQNSPKSAAVFAGELRDNVEKKHNELNQKLDSLSNVGLIQLARDAVLKSDIKTNFSELSPELNEIYQNFITEIQEYFQYFNAEAKKENVVNFFEKIKKYLEEKYPDQQESITKVFSKDSNFVKGFVGISQDEKFVGVLEQMFVILTSADFAKEEKIKLFLQKAPNGMDFPACLPGVGERIFQFRAEFFEDINSKIFDIYNQTKQELINKFGLRNFVDEGMEIHLMPYLDFIIGTLYEAEVEKKDGFYKYDQKNIPYDIDYKITQEFPKLFRQKLKEIAENDKRFYCFKKESEADQRINGFIAQLEDMAIVDIQRFEDEDYTLEGSLDEVFSPVFGKGKNQEYLIINDDETYALNQEAIKQKITKKTEEFNKVLEGKSARQNQEIIEEIIAEDLTSERSMAKIAKYLQDSDDDKLVMALDALISLSCIRLNNGIGHAVQMVESQNVEVDEWRGNLYKYIDVLYTDFIKNESNKDLSEIIKYKLTLAKNMLDVNSEMGIVCLCQQKLEQKECSEIPLRTALAVGLCDEDIYKIIDSLDDPLLEIVNLARGRKSSGELETWEDPNRFVEIYEFLDNEEKSANDIISCFSSNPRTIKIFQKLKNKIEEKDKSYQGKKIKTFDHYLIAKFTLSAIKNGNCELAKYLMENFAMFEVNEIFPSKQKTTFDKSFFNFYCQSLIIKVIKRRPELLENVLESLSKDYRGGKRIYFDNREIVFSAMQDKVLESEFYSNSKKFSILRYVASKRDLESLKKIVDILRIPVDDLVCMIGDLQPLPHIAALYNFPEFITFLKEKGADLSQILAKMPDSSRVNSATKAAKMPDSSGVNSATKAADSCNDKFFEALLDCGISRDDLVAIRSEEGSNLNILVGENNILRNLVKSGAKNSKKDPKKIEKYKNFLRILMKKNILSKEEIESLICHSENKNNFNCAELALQEGNINFIHAFIEVGLDKKVILFNKDNPRITIFHHIPSENKEFLYSLLEINFYKEIKEINKDNLILEIENPIEIFLNAQNGVLENECKILDFAIKFFGIDNIRSQFDKLNESNESSESNGLKDHFEPENQWEFKSTLRYFLDNGLMLDEIYSVTGFEVDFYDMVLQELRGEEFNNLLISDKVRKLAKENDEVKSLFVSCLKKIVSESVDADVKKEIMIIDNYLGAGFTLNDFVSDENSRSFEEKIDQLIIHLFELQDEASKYFFNIDFIRDRILNNQDKFITNNHARIANLIARGVRVEIISCLRFEENFKGFLFYIYTNAQNPDCYSKLRNSGRTGIIRQFSILKKYFDEVDNNNEDESKKRKTIFINFVNNLNAGDINYLNEEQFKYLIDLSIKTNAKEDKFDDNHPLRKILSIAVLHNGAKVAVNQYLQNKVIDIKNDSNESELILLINYAILQLTSEVLQNNGRIRLRSETFPLKPILSVENFAKVIHSNNIAILVLNQKYLEPEYFDKIVEMSIREKNYNFIFQYINEEFNMSLRITDLQLRKIFSAIISDPEISIGVLRSVINNNYQQQDRKINFVNNFCSVLNENNFENISSEKKLSILQLFTNDLVISCCSIEQLFGVLKFAICDENKNEIRENILKIEINAVMRDRALLMQNSFARTLAGLVPLQNQSSHENLNKFLSQKISDDKTLYDYVKENNFVEIINFAKAEGFDFEGQKEVAAPQKRKANLEEGGVEEGAVLKRRPSRYNLQNSLRKRKGNSEEEGEEATSNGEQNPSARPKRRDSTSHEEPSSLKEPDPRSGNPNFP